MAYDEMELEQLGEERTAMFVIISDTDDTLIKNLFLFKLRSV